MEGKALVAELTWPGMMADNGTAVGFVPASWKVKDVIGVDEVGATGVVVTEPTGVDTAGVDAAEALEVLAAAVVPE